MTVQEKYERSCRIEERILTLVLGMSFFVLLYATASIVMGGLDLGAFQ